MMRKRILLILGATLLFLGAGSSRAEPAARQSAIFCPECWIYLWGAGATDMKGNCATCGKYPVELEVRPMAWSWCAREKRWLEFPCIESRAKQCCTREESLGAVMPRGEKMFEAGYCPLDRSFEVFRLPILGELVCSRCARPAVKVLAQKRAWYWCTAEGVWGPEPCSLNAVQKCCSKREALLLVKPEPGPIAKMTRP